MAVEIVCFVEKCIASWASESFEEVVVVIDVEIVVVVLQKFHCILEFTNTSPS